MKRSSYHEEFLMISSWEKRIYNRTWEILNFWLLNALLWQNAKCNVNPGLSHFEQRTLACTRLLANLHFVFCQSKATLPYLPMHSLQIHDNFWFKASNSLRLNGDLPSMMYKIVSIISLISQFLMNYIFLIPGFCLQYQQVACNA